MKLLLLLILSLLSINTFAVDATAVIQQGHPFISWRGDPNFTYTLLRRTNDTTYEVVENDFKGNSYYHDLSAEPNMQYYYIVAANSKELKLDVATDLLKSFPLGPAAAFESLNRVKHIRNEDSIVFIGTNKLELYKITTDIQFDVRKKYVVKFHLGELNPYLLLQISIGGVGCKPGAIESKYFVQNGTYECSVNPTVGVNSLDRSFFSNDLLIYISSMGGVGKVEIRKIEIWGFEN